MSDMCVRTLKLEIKNWEYKFEKLNNRKPTKDDVKDAPTVIKNAYKQYRDLKSSTQTWGNHLNKKTKEPEVKLDDEIIEKLAAKVCGKKSDDVRAIKTRVESKIQLPTTNENEEKVKLNLNESTFKISTVKKAKFFRSMSVTAADPSSLICRRLSVDNEWLNRCNGKVKTNEDKLEESKNPSIDEFEPLMIEKNVEQTKKREEINEMRQEVEEESNFSPSISTSQEISPQRENLPPTSAKTETENGNFHSISTETEILPYKPLENENFNSIKLTKNPRRRSPSPEMPSKKPKVDLTRPKQEQKLQILERKMKSGSANENFVRIDIKKKKFHRGKTKFSAVKYKRKQWAMRQKYKDDTDEAACFRCGEMGHWVKNCPGKKTKEDVLYPQNDEEEEASPFLTLVEAANLACGIKPDPNVTRVQVFDTSKKSENVAKNSEKIEEEKPEFDVFDFDDIGDEEFCKIEENVQKIVDNSCTISQESSIKPVFNLNENRKVLETPKIVYDALKKFGYDEFRPGQEETIMRILSGLSTLLILSTGAGKSLCYQLPAYLYKQKSNCIVLVISPLVSLMDDQVTGLPPCLKAVCLHNNLTSTQKQKSLDAISSGKVHVLLISPEMAVNSKGFSKLPKDLPPIAFACIDEAHCVSEWSHNFRPSYLRLNKILREEFKVSCILALTATATNKTAESIARHLQIPRDSSGVIRGVLLPSNLCLSVSRDIDKDEALINLLKGERFASCSSIIIYCTRREQTEKLATVIRTCLEQFSSGAEAYHAGLSAAKRRSVQNAFMKGKLQLVVATVAFGMGLDKSDVRAIIHYNMPRRFENYVQEIGRAGRDGKDAHCHLFLDSHGNDMMELRRHIYANIVDRSSLRKLLRHVFPPCKCDMLNEKSGIYSRCMKHEVAVSIEELVQKLDLKEENVSTLLCYLELSPEKWIEILNPVYSWCKITCYAGANQLKQTSRKCPPLAAAIAVDMKNGKNYDKSSTIEFPIVEIASRMGWNSGIVKRELKALEWTTINGKYRKSGVMVEFSNLSFHFKSFGNLNDEQLDGVLDYLHFYVDNQIKTELEQLEMSYKAFHDVSKLNYWNCSDTYDRNKSDKLKGYLKDYFEGRPIEVDESISVPRLNSEDKRAAVESDIRSFLSIHNDQNFTGRAIARIFSGIDSPCFPARVWGRVRRFWRSHLDVDFDLMCKWATQEIIRLK